MKERIIGATVLVLFVVLVVPVFLDGPENDNEVISQNVPLPGQSDSENQTVVLHRDREHPEPVANAATPVEEAVTEPESPVAAAPAAEQSVPAQPEPQQQATVARQDPEPDAASTAAAQAQATENEKEPPVELASSTGMWAVQLGSFGNQENADKLAADLRKQNFTAFLSKLTTGNGELHRVRIGPQKDRESAEKVAEQLAKAGHKGQVVPHP